MTVIKNIWANLIKILYKLLLPWYNKHENKGNKKKKGGVRAYFLNGTRPFSFVNIYSEKGMWL